MVKLKKLRAKTTVKSTNKSVAPKQTIAAAGSTDKSSMSRGQRKRLEKTAKVMRKKGVVIKSAEKSGKNDNKHMFSEIESSLCEDSNVRPAACNASNVNNKIMKTVAIREVERMKLVQQHPQFVQDPIATMKAHFTQMVAAQVKCK